VGQPAANYIIIWSIKRSRGNEPHCMQVTRQANSTELGQQAVQGVVVQGGSGGGGFGGKSAY